MYMHGSVCDAGCTHIPDTHCAGVIGWGDHSSSRTEHRAWQPVGA